MDAKQTPLIDLLKRVPENARCRVDESDGMGSVFIPVGRLCHEAAAALEQPGRTLTDEVIADLWHQNGGFHHHFARAVERYLKGEK